MEDSLNVNFTKIKRNKLCYFVAQGHFKKAFIWVVFSFQDIFEPYLKSFYVRSSDPTHIKLLKVSEVCSIVCLTKLQFYINS